MHQFFKLLLLTFLWSFFSCGWAFAQSDNEYLRALEFEGQVGHIDLAGVALLKVPDNFVFISGKKSKSPFRSDCDTVECIGFLVSQQVVDSIPPIFIELLYVESGYIPDSAIITASEKDFWNNISVTVAEQNKTFKDKGCDTLKMSSWVMQPYFLSKDKLLHWAVACETSKQKHTWYSIKKMGRYGFIEMNIRTSPKNLLHTTPQLSVITSSIKYYEGFKYRDFDPNLDKLAVFGIAGLLAGKVLTQAKVVPFAFKWLKWIVIALLGLFTFLKKKILRKDPKMDYLSSQQ